MDFDSPAAKFDEAIMLLPLRLREHIRKLPKEKRAKTEEIRLRLGQKPTVSGPWGEEPFSDTPISGRDIDLFVDIITGASSHTFKDTVKNGYITAKGGFRVGLGGSVIMSGGEVSYYRTVYSAAVRIPRQFIGISDGIIGDIADGAVKSTLIVSPPGGGKTTLLRDVVRSVSEMGFRVSLIDERCEIAAVSGGKSFDVGKCTDIIDGCPKSIGIDIATRVLTPSVIAVDEITQVCDIEKMINSHNCGIKFLATAHAADENELKSRPLYSKLLASGIFENIVFIEKDKDNRHFTLRKAAKL